MKKFSDWRRRHTLHHTATASSSSTVVPAPTITITTPTATMPAQSPSQYTWAPPAPAPAPAPATPTPLQAPPPVKTYNNTLGSKHTSYVMDANIFYAYLEERFGAEIEFNLTNVDNRWTFDLPIQLTDDELEDLAIELIDRCEEEARRRTARNQQRRASAKKAATWGSSGTGNSFDGAGAATAAT